MQFRICNLLVLIEVRDRRIQLAGLRIGLLRHLLRLTCLGTGLHCLLVCCIRRALSLVNSCLGATVDVLNIVRVLSGELIELVQPVFYGRYLPIDPLLTGQGIHLAPKTLSRLGWQRLPGGIC